MKISARNQFPGAVKSVTQGAVMAEVVGSITWIGSPRPG
jgi:molybdopterin-binding protein